MGITRALGDRLVRGIVPQATGLASCHTYYNHCIGHIVYSYVTICCSGKYGCIFYEGRHVGTC